MYQTNLMTITPATLQKRIDQYFERNKKGTLSMTGLALHLGITRKTLIEYAKTDAIGQVLEMAKLRCENKLEERMIQGVPPTGMIFILKNNYGWKDKVEVDQTINGTLSLATLFDRAEEAKRLKAAQEEPIEGEVVDEKVPDELF